MFLFLKTVQFHLWGLAHFLLQEHWRNKTNLTVGKLRYLPHYLLDRGIKLQLQLNVTSLMRNEYEVVLIRGVVCNITIQY